MMASYVAKQVVDYQTEQKWVQVAWKCSPVFLLAWEAGLRQPKTQLQYYVSKGLFLSALGDIALDLQPSNETLFITGLLFFLVAHIAYSVGFETLSLQDTLGSCTHLFKALLWQVVITCAYGYMLLYMHESPMAVPVTAYVIFISVMVHRALARCDPDSTDFGHFLT